MSTINRTSSNSSSRGLKATSETSRFAEAKSPDVAGSSDPLMMKVSETQAERTAAFELVHDVYSRAGLTADSGTNMRVLKHHLLDTTDVLVASREGEINFTVTLIRDGENGLPSESLFAKQIHAMRSQGLRLAEVSCVASSSGEDADKKQRFEMFVRMISLTIQSARRRGIERLLLAVHPRHAKLYQRLFGCLPCSDVKQYDAVQGNPAILCTHDFAELDQQRYPLYKKIYDASYDPWQLDGTRMSSEEKRFFKQALSDHTSQFVPMAA